MAIQGTQSWKYVGSAALKGFEVLKVGTNQGECTVATAVTDKILGVAAHAVSAGNVTPQNLAVYMPGQTVKMQASAAISLFAYVMPTTAGQIVTASAKSGTGNTTVSWYLGYAVEAAGAADELINVFFWPTEVNV